MIESMTGYGKTVLQLPSKKIVVEIRSLNSKNLDINTRIPVEYREKELDIRKKIAKKLVRGKIDFTIFIESVGVDDSVKINTTMVKKYIAELQALSSDTADHLLEIAMSLPEAVTTLEKKLDPKEWKAIDKIIDKSFQKVQKYRRTEGAQLESDFKKRIHTLLHLLDKIKECDTIRKEEIRIRLQKAVGDIRESVDENRFEQEILYYLEKLDITEEQVRLKNHLEYYLHVMKTDESNGKKLGFISQEIGREINTLGAKANNAPMQKITIQMKDELEKIKEQNLNIL